MYALKKEMIDSKRMSEKSFHDLLCAAAEHDAD